MIYEDDMTGKPTGICIDILHTLSQMFNFSYNLRLVPDGKYGSLNPDGSWNGMVGYVHRGTAKSSVYKEMWDKSAHYERNQVKMHVDSVEKMLTSPYIYLQDLSKAQACINKNCKLAIAQKRFFPSLYGFVFPENSPYLPFINKKIRLMKETGLMLKFYKNHKFRDNCVAETAAMTTNYKPASFTDFTGALFVLAAGIALAYVVLMMEQIIHTIIQLRGQF